MFEMHRNSLLRALALIAVTAFLFIQAPFAPAGAAVVGVGSAQPTFHGGILVDGQGMTLYTFAKDAKGKSNCTGMCASHWPPLFAASGASASGNFSIISRPDGSKQWAYKGWPLYRFKKDAAPGQEKGNGFKGLWSVVKASAMTH
ncbi:MAG TPA: hypothetical protein VMD47_05825 [Candidatus Acidoferrales bacterium]|nr:hypothetical protein [Candidatus Acidoferrales bacterium]